MKLFVYADEPSKTMYEMPWRWKQTYKTDCTRVVFDTTDTESNKTSKQKAEPTDDTISGSRADDETSVATKTSLFLLRRGSRVRKVSHPYFQKFSHSLPLHKEPRSAWISIFDKEGKLQDVENVHQ